MLTAQHVENLAGCCRLHHLHVHIGAQLHEPLQSGCPAGGVLVLRTVRFVLGEKDLRSLPVGVHGGQQELRLDLRCGKFTEECDQALWCGEFIQPGQQHIHNVAYRPP